MNLRKYITVIKLSFQNQMEYKLNYILSFAIKLIPFIVNLLIWLTVLTNEHHFSMNQYEIITYYIISLISTNMTVCTINYEMSDDIKSGNINKYLLQPFSYIKYQLFKDLPIRFNFILFGFLPITLIICLFRNYIDINYNLKNITFFLLILVLGYYINFLVTFILGELSFYFNDVSSLYASFDVLKGIVSGAIVPITLFPNFLKNILLYLPFSYITYIPNISLIINFSLAEYILYFTICISWCIVLTFICKLIWKRCLLNYSAFNG